MSPGVVLPGDFIPIAEESGRIIEIGRRVLVEACTRVHAFGESMTAGKGLRVAVNISGLELVRAVVVPGTTLGLETIAGATTAGVSPARAGSSARTCGCGRGSRAGIF